MMTGEAVNADPDAVVVVDTNQMEWEETGHPGVTRKVLERVIDQEKGRETVLLRFAPGSSLPTERLDRRLDIFVIEGTYSDGSGEYGPRTFLRRPPGGEHAPHSKAGCTLYAKYRNAFRDDDERLTIDTGKVEWMSFPHRGADVVHFYRDRHGIETSRFGKVYPEKKIPSHDHAMGEETLIIDGYLKDEYGTYGPGVWFRSPIGIPHAPYTEDQPCFMLIREGDLVW